MHNNNNCTQHNSNLSSLDSLVNCNLQLNCHSASSADLFSTSSCVSSSGQEQQQQRTDQNLFQMSAIPFLNFDQIHNLHSSSSSSTVASSSAVTTSNFDLLAFGGGRQLFGDISLSPSSIASVSAAVGSTSSTSASAISTLNNQQSLHHQQQQQQHLSTASADMLLGEYSTVGYIHLFYFI